MHSHRHVCVCVWGGGGATVDLCTKSVLLLLEWRSLAKSTYINNVKTCSLCLDRNTKVAPQKQEKDRVHLHRQSGSHFLTTVLRSPSLKLFQKRFFLCITRDTLYLLRNSAVRNCILCLIHIATCKGQWLQVILSAMKVLVSGIVWVDGSSPPRISEIDARDQSMVICWKILFSETKPQIQHSKSQKEVLAI